MTDPASLVVLITGATAGFGAATARRFVKEGARVIATGRRRERLDALAAELGERLHPLVLDVRDPAAVDGLPGRLPPEVAEPNVLVNNAGLALGTEPAHQASWDAWQTMIDTNITALARLTHRLLPGMVERGRGHVINLGSVAGTYPYPGGNVYGGTKGFVKLFSLNLIADLVTTPVRVTNIEPGLCESEFSVVRFRGDEAKAAQVYAGTQPITPADIAETIYWCATLPAHVNVNRVEMMPTCQGPGAFAIHRQDS